MEVLFVYSQTTVAQKYQEGFYQNGNFSIVMQCHCTRFQSKKFAARLTLESLPDFECFRTNLSSFLKKRKVKTENELVIWILSAQQFNTILGQTLPCVAYRTVYRVTRFFWELSTLIRRNTSGLLAGNLTWFKSAA